MLNFKTLLFSNHTNAQCSILLVTRVVFNFITERGKERENLFLLQVYMLAVPRVLTLDHQVFYKICRILCNCLFSKRKKIHFFKLFINKSGASMVNLFHDLSFFVLISAL